MRKVLLVYCHAPNRPGLWAIAFVAEDGTTPIGKPRIVRDIDALERIIDKLHGNGARARTNIYNWGQSSEWIQLSAKQCAFFEIPYES